MLNRRRAIFGFAILALTFLTPAADAGSGAEPMAVVVSSDSSVTDLSLYKLKRLYLGDNIVAPSGRKLIPLNRGKNTAERVDFDERVLDMSPAESSRYWIDRRIRGRSGAPKAVDPARVVQKVVAEVPGAISYVRLSELSDQVKVVKIGGKKPGDSGYPIVVGSRSQASAPWQSTVF
jgi:hypothetical protein